MQASIITVGDEILIGQVIDSNSAWLGQQLSEIGISVKKIWSVGDLSDQIILGMKQALEETDILFMTGGLGPTKDDITKKAIADFLGRDMYFDEPTFERIKSIFEKLGRSMSPSHHDQCMMPNGVEIL
ncbi:MAG TPA: competence/damage-inducible protein A, partial [Saprospiraceae bacterium]|nr:competence/damage-inducible protein A [Saprospiraceae bacterium]